MEKILISACLLGEKVRYTGEVYPVQSEFIIGWERESRLVPFCPEVEGGLGVPRFPSEIQGGEGIDVLSGRCRVMDKEGNDVTSQFLAGADKAIRLINQHHIKMAVLKSGSPACGQCKIYDGFFRGRMKKGDGVLTAGLKQWGVTVFNERDLEKAEHMIRRLENQA